VESGISITAAAAIQQSSIKVPMYCVEDRSIGIGRYRLCK